MSVTLIVNPNAGRGRARRYINAIQTALTDAGVDVHTVHSGSRGDIERQAIEAINRGERRVVVAGGDGSINEAVNGILRANSEAELGVIPIGTGNDFAKAASLPSHWEHAAALLADRLESDAPSRSVDVGRLNDRYFANVAGVGFDADVSAVANTMRLPIGDLVYLFALFRAMRRLIPKSLELKFDDESVQGDLLLVTFCNGPWAGGLFQFAPAAVNDDGMLDLVYLDAVKRRRLVFLLAKLLRGKHLGEPEVHMRTVRRSTLRSDQPLIWHVDGEVQEPANEFEMELLPGALRLL